VTIGAPQCGSNCAANRGGICTISESCSGVTGLAMNLTSPFVMTPGISESIFPLLSLFGAAVPPRDPDDDEDEDDEEDGGDADHNREPAIIREPDEDE
jgi:hypothetical protein